MKTNILEDIRFITGKGYLAAFKSDKSKAKSNGNQYHKINELSTKMPVRDYFLSQTGYRDGKFTDKLFRFEKLSVFTLNKGKKQTEYAFLKLADSEMGAVISMSAIKSIAELAGINIEDITLYGNVSTEPFVATDKSLIPFGLLFPLSSQWISSESFYSNSKINLVSDYNFYCKKPLNNKRKINSNLHSLFL